MPVMEIEHTGWPRYPCKTVATKAKKKIQPRFKSSSSERPIDTSATTSNAAAAAAAAAELKSPTTVSISSSSESDSGMKSSSSPSDGGSGPTGHGNESGGKGSSRREHLAANLTDRDVLDCPICCQPLCSPVYQCTNGHITCAACCKKTNNKCSTCRRVTGVIRCRGLEKVLESLTFPCKNSSSGCTESLSHTERLSHEETCEFTPFPCPFPGCKFSDEYRRVYRHFTLEHSNLSQTFSFGTSISFVGNYEDKFFLQEKIRKTLFVCTRAVSSHGVEVDVFCVGPASLEGAPFSCDLTAKVGVGTSLNIKTSVECKQERTDEDRSGKYLFVPRDLMKGVVPSYKIKSNSIRKTIVRNCLEKFLQTFQLERDHSFHQVPRNKKVLSRAILVRPLLLALYTRLHIQRRAHTNLRREVARKRGSLKGSGPHTEHIYLNPMGTHSTGAHEKRFADLFLKKEFVLIIAHK